MTPKQSKYLYECKSPGKVTVALFKYISMKVRGDKSTRWPNRY